MSRSQRRAMIDREEPKLSLVRQCALLGISRSSLYYLPTEAGAEDLELMALIDQQYLKTPYGSRRMTAWLRNHGHQVNRKRVRRLGCGPSVRPVTSSDSLCPSQFKAMASGKPISVGLEGSSVEQARGTRLG